MNNNCCACIIKPKVNCFNCEMKKACKSCLDLISQKKSYSTNINMLKRKPPNEYHQMLPHYEGKSETNQNNIDFESAKNILMEADKKMIVKRRFERIFNMMKCKSYTKNEDISGNKELDSNTLKRIKSIIIS